MGWEDRDYYRERPAGGEAMFRIASFMNWSFPAGRLLGIRVRVHWTLLFLLLIYLIRQGNPLWTLRWFVILFASVLLHEFGHALACRRVGGQADEVLLWPLGGLAYVSPPRRIAAEFWTVLWGPLVTAILAVGGYLGATMWFGIVGSLTPRAILEYGFEYYAGVGGLLWEVYSINLGLLLFNLLLIFYPFDGGRLVQIAAWKVVGYGKSMYWAATIGLFGAGAVVLLGVVSGSLMLILIGGFGALTCYTTRIALRHGDDAEEEVYAPAYPRERPAGRARRRGFLRRWRDQRVVQAQHRAEEEETRLVVEVDRILDKVKHHGLHSLSAREKKTLQRATDRQRRAG